jgi:hypothetical protein
MQTPASIQSSGLLSQALSQLVRAAPTNPLAAQAAKALVQHINQYQLALHLNHSKQHEKGPEQTVTLNKKGLSGQLQHQQTYQLGLRIIQQANTQTDFVLDFFSPVGQKKSIPLTQTQAQQLLSAIVSKSSDHSVAQLVVNNARVTHVKPTHIELTLADRSRVNLPIKSTVKSLLAGWKIGQQVLIQLSQVGQQWQATIRPESSSDSPTSNQGLKLTLSSQASLPLLNSALNSDKLAGKSTGLQIDSNILTQQLNQPRSSLASLKQSHLSYADALQHSQIRLIQKAGNQFALQITQPNTIPAASISVTPKHAQVLLKSGIAMSQQEPYAPNSVLSGSGDSDRLSLSTKASHHQISATHLSREHQVEDIASSNKTSQIPLVSKLDAKQQQKVLNQVPELLRILNTRSASPSETSKPLLNGITELLTTQPDLAPLLKTLNQQLSKIVSAEQTPSTAEIKQILQQPALAISSTSLLQPAKGNDLLTGLIKLIQLSLSAKLHQNQPKLAPLLQNWLASAVQATKQSSANLPLPTSNTRNMLQDIEQAQTRHQLLKQLNGFLANHSLSKLSTAEQSVQGQDSLYYVLPNGSGDNRQDTELLIRREPDQEVSTTGKRTARSLWHLTMKLDAGNWGQILAKAKLGNTDKQPELILDLYCSEQRLQRKTLQLLPFFDKRLQDLGIAVKQSRCQLGRIPERLHQRPHHIFQTQV